MDICKRTRRDGDERNLSSDTLFSVFMIFGVCNVLFICYIAVDNMIQRDEMETEISEISEILNRLRIPNPADDCLNGKDSCKRISKMIAKLQSCERRGSILKLMKDQMEKRREYLKMWDNVPKPFIHAQMRNPSIEGNRLYGWNATAENCEYCEGLDPKIEHGRIKVKMPGHYYIYSQVTFQCPSHTHHHGLHRHSTERLRKKSDTLMTNSYQLCGSGEQGKLKVSYQSGIYELGLNDQLLVTVEKPKTTKLFVDDDNHNDDLFFGAYLV